MAKIAIFEPSKLPNSLLRISVTVKSMNFNTVSHQPSGPCLSIHKIKDNDKFDLNTWTILREINSQTKYYSLHLLIL